VNASSDLRVARRLNNVCAYETRRILLVRGVVGYGGGSDEGADTSRRTRDLRVGIEADTCTSGRGACAFLGVDFGWRFMTTTDYNDEVMRDTSHWLRVHRVGVDAGGDFIRVRAEFQIAAPGAGGIQLALVHRFY
jgi:hypothetical protein